MVGLAVTYVLSNKYVFGESKFASKKADFVLFALIGLIGLLLLNLLMWGLTGGIGINYLASKILATIVVYIWNFFARRALYKN
jgi:putative flippase GtrA